MSSRPPPPPPRRAHGRPVQMTAQEAVSDIGAGAHIAVGGFGLCGLPLHLLAALRACATTRAPPVTDLTLITGTLGGEDVGVGPLFAAGLVRRVVTSHLADNKVVAAALYSGAVDLELCAMGTLTERMRAAGAGVAAFYTPTGYGTAIAEGGLPRRFARRRTGATQPKNDKDDGDKADVVVVTAYSSPRETRCIDGRWCCYETALHADVALVHAWRADAAGNLLFRGTARNLNEAAARCARVCIVEVEELVACGSLGRDAVHLPGVYVQRLVVLPSPSCHVKYVDYLVTRSSSSGGVATAAGSEHDDARHRIARRAALEVCRRRLHNNNDNSSNKSDGGNCLCVNLGVGIPTLVAQYVPPQCADEVLLMANSGLLGVGPYPATARDADADLVNANKQTVTTSTTRPACTLDMIETMSLTRGGYVDVAMLGGMQVSACGDLASWWVPGKMLVGMGGAMDLLASAASGNDAVDNDEDDTDGCGGCKVVVLMKHTNRDGTSRVVPQCTLPLTGRGVVDVLITDLAVFALTRRRRSDGGGGTAARGKTLELRELAAGVSLDTVRKQTAAPFTVAASLQTMLLAPVPADDAVGVDA